MNYIEPHCESLDINSSPTLTLADVMARIEGRQEITQKERRELLSAVRTICRIVGLEPGSVSAEPRSLREHLDNVPLAYGGLSRTRWNNVKTLLLAALDQAGIKTMAGRASEPLSPPWAALQAVLTEPKLRIGLSRFMSFCSAREIAPDGVDVTTFDLFHQALGDESLVRDLGKVNRDSRRRWNKAAATIPGWPAVRVEIPKGSRFYSLPWNAFPPSLQIEVETFLTRAKSPNPFAENYSRSIKPSTLELRREELQQIASALVLSGLPAEQVTGLATLTEPANARLALKFFWDRVGGKSTPVIQGKALLLAAIAKHEVKAPEQQVKELVQLAQNLRVEKSGMTSKNRARLRQFDDDANVDALLNLPYRVFREVRRKPVGDRGEALRVMLALAVEVLIMAPIRIDNLVSLEIGRNLVRTRPGPNGVVHVVLPEEKVKNGAAYEVELPKETADLLGTYLKTYRPRLATTPSAWLFPNDEGKRRVTVPFSTSLAKFIRRETGITMNAHLFRHLAATLHLTAHPDDLETARRILGHKSLATTMRFYAEMKTKQAFERYGAMIKNRRGPGREQPSSTSRRGRRSTGK